jgi:hypothetical protein
MRGYLCAYRSDIPVVGETEEDMDPNFLSHPYDAVQTQDTILPCVDFNRSVIMERSDPYAG